MDKHQEENDENNVNVPEINKQKQVLFTEITGKVKWFNVKLGYGFVCRNDNHEDIFIHQSAIVKSNPDHQRKSVEDGEEILFDIVQGMKGNEAFNVSGLNGNCVKGSEYALRYQRGRGRARGRGRTSYRSSSGTHPDQVEGGARTKEFVRGGKGRGGGAGKPNVQNLSKPKAEQEPKLPQNEKPMICAKVTGKVKWFNVKRGYGFVCRNDNQQDIFIHQSAIVKSNPEHPRKSVKDGEEILFDVVKGDKGDEASNVSAADGSCVKGSDYALRYPRSRYRSQSRGRDLGRPRGRGQPRSREISEHYEEFRNGPGGGNDYEQRQGRPMMMRRPMRGGRMMFRGGRPYNQFVGGPDYHYGYDMPPPPREYMYEMDEFFDQPMRGRGGGGMRYNGPRPPPRDMGPMRFDDSGPGQFPRRAGANRGRPRGLRPWGPGRPRGRRWNGPRPAGEPLDEQRDVEPAQGD